MAILHVDSARYPVVCCRLEAGVSGERGLAADCEAYLRCVREHSGEFAVVHDWTQAHVLTQDERRAVFLAVFCNQALAQRCVGHFVIAESPLARGALTALTWMQRTRYPVRVTPLSDTAFAWAAEQLRPAAPDYLSRVERAQAEREFSNW